MTSTMARLIVLVASGALLFCQTLATSAMDLKESIGQEEERLGRDSNYAPMIWQGSPDREDLRASPVGHLHSEPHTSYPSGGEMYQPAQPYPAQGLQYQQPPYAEPLPGMYSNFLPSSRAVQPQHEAFPAYLPAPAVQPQYEPYPGYQPAPGIQPQYEPYPVYQPAPAVQPQYEPYPAYQPAPAVQPQPEPYPVYQPAPAVQPQHEPYPVYQPAPAVQPQYEPYPAYQPAPAVQPQPEPYPVYQPAPAVQPQPAAYPIYLPAPVVQPQAQPYPAPLLAPAALPQSGAYPVHQPAPVAQPQPIAYPIHPPAPAVQPQPNVVVRYIPGLMTRNYRCRQKVECGWNYVTKPGKYIYIRYYPQPTPASAPIRRIVYVCPQQQCPAQRPCYSPAPIVPLPAPQIVYPPAVPIQQQMCAGHSQCSTGQHCCYAPYTAGMSCVSGTAVPLRSTRHLQMNNTVGTRSQVELVIGQWQNSNVTSFVTDLLLPLKVDLENDMEVILRSDAHQEQSFNPCGVRDANCIGSRLLRCVAKIWPSETQPLPIGDGLLHSRLAAPMEGKLDAALVAPLVNSTDDFPYLAEADFWNFEDPDSFGENLEEEVVEVDPVQSAIHARQVRQLSFTACLLQSFGAGVVERKRSALLAAKRCVRAYKLEWPRVRACVAPPGQGAAVGDWRQYSGRSLPLGPPVEMAVNGEPVADLDNLKLALCRALLKAGQAPLLCDLLYDELDQDQVEQGSVNTDGNADNLMDEDQKDQTLRTTDYRGAWTDLGLGSPNTPPWDQAGRSSDGMQEDVARRERTNSWGPEPSEDESVGFSMSRVSQTLDEIPDASTHLTMSQGDPYEV